VTCLVHRLRDRMTRPGCDAGVSLAELLVVSLVSTILLGALGVLFAGTLDATRRAGAHTAATAEGRLAMDVVAQRLRVAVRPSAGAAMFSEATASSVTFYASLSDPGSTAHPAPSEVRYVLDSAAGCLRETITAASGAVRSRCLAFGDIAPTFSYFQVTKRPTLIEPSPSPAPTEPLPLTTDGGLSADDAKKVGAVQVDLSVLDVAAAESSNPVRLSTRVLIVNELNEEAA
jgi:hypothetical protein